MNIQQIDLKNKKVLVRVDFNVPINKSTGKVKDASRIHAAVPTIQYILNQGGACILMSHFGRPEKDRLPDGSVNKEKFTLKQILSTLEVEIQRSVTFVEDCIGSEVKAVCSTLVPGQVLLLENTRFYPEEEKGDVQFAKELASFGEVYINDAFGTAHRAHASTAVIAQFFGKNQKGFGFLMSKELESAQNIMNHPQHPSLAIVGGAKVSDKILLLENLLTKVDALIIGGGMAYTFIKARGGSIGKSLLEEDKIPLALAILDKAKKSGKEIYLPADSVIADQFSNDANKEVSKSDLIPDGWMGLDIGEKAIAEYSKIIQGSKTIFWNGPMGVFEMPAFSQGTFSIAKAVAAGTEQGAFSLVGGGDSIAAIHQSGLESKMSFISTGGGAMLELLEGKELPGVKAILQ